MVEDINESGLTLGDMVAEARAAFQSAQLSEPAIDARVLISGLLDYSLTDMISRSSQKLAQEAVARIRLGILRRIAGEPVHRILGFREFYGLKLRLSAETLEPRPDTEILIEQVLPHLRAIIARKEHARIVDLGTGTGAICLALLQECPQAEGVGADISRDALSTAMLNARENGLESRFRAIESDWFSAIEGRFDVIVSNPPYIPTADIGGLSDEVRLFDPMAALDGGPDGLLPYRVIAEQGSAYLEPDGIVAVETGWDQKDAIGAIFAQAGYAMLAAAKDYGGHDRAMVFAIKGD
jgi:release factor glutamine methyltransferase